MQSRIFFNAAGGLMAHKILIRREQAVQYRSISGMREGKQSEPAVSGSCVMVRTESAQSKNIASLP
jgi:hypothetical protein